VGQNKPPKWAKPSCQSQSTGRAGGFTVAGPSKGPFRNRPKQKQEQKQKPRTAVFTTAAQSIRERAYSRNSQSSTATPAEPGDLPWLLDLWWLRNEFPESHPPD